jgi:hypothetical protein
MMARVREWAAGRRELAPGQREQLATGVELLKRLFEP